MGKTRKQMIINMVLMAVLLTVGSWSALAQARTELKSAQLTSLTGEFTAGELVVKFKADASPQSTQNALQAYKAHHIRSLYGRDVDLWRVAEGRELDIAAQLNADPSVEYAEPNYVYHALIEPNDPELDKQWAHAHIHTPAAWDMSTGSPSVTIAIIDSGIDLNHPDLADKIVPGYDFVDDDDDPTDMNGHGTHCAGIAAAISNNGVGVAGVDWQARIMPIRSLDERGGGSAVDIADGITWAFQHGAQVHSLSLSGPKNSRLFQDAINDAFMAGSLVVAAMGNCRMCDPDPNPVSYPAACDNVMAVAATGPDGAYTSYSQYGAHCDIAAPGGVEMYNAGPGGIYSTMPTYSVYLNTRYGFAMNYDHLWGTSMATPQVAGLAALVWSQRPDLEPAQVQKIIESSAQDLGDAGWDPDYGHGMIDAAVALQMTSNLDVPTLAPIDNLDQNGDYVVAWSQVADADAYTLQQANTAWFDAPIMLYSGSERQYQVGQQAGGVWYYRVLAECDGCGDCWSNVQATAVLPNRPQIAPIENPDLQDAYQIRWTVETDTSYRLEEDDNPAFGSPRLRFNGPASQYLVINQPAGEWYYRVRASNQVGESDWSELQSTEVLGLQLYKVYLPCISK